MHIKRKFLRSASHFVSSDRDSQLYSRCEAKRLITFIYAQHNEGKDTILATNGHIALRISYDNPENVSSESFIISPKAEFLKLSGSNKVAREESLNFEAKGEGYQVKTEKKVYSNLDRKGVDKFPDIHELFENFSQKENAPNKFAIDPDLIEKVNKGRKELGLKNDRIEWNFPSQTNMPILLELDSLGYSLESNLRWQCLVMPQQIKN